MAETKLIPIDFILYRGKDNELRFLAFEGAYDPERGHIYNRDGSTPTLPFSESVVVAGEKGRCPCCGEWLELTPCTDVLSQDGRVSHVPHFAARCRICKAAGQFTVETCPTHSGRSN
jgi:hypothetical protein